ncbi:MAG: class I mannose-6-phosphate isomerase [Ruminococcaceae bacterium]|nr:class I mannose-6-phosphate isomerase [Oscillospiraceae bacterium]
MLYPLFLTPALKDFIWGGRRLPAEYGYETALDKVAEAWVLSCHPQGSCVVRNGPLAGKTLPQALAEEGLTGEFPLLIKLIDARDRLSVQVHPDDAYARRVEGEQGKTEMWVVLDCEPGARLLYGLTRELTRETLERHIRENTLDEVARYVPVKPGDCFFIPAGTLHAIGAGILLAEVQQNSATTYRVSDYGRLGADGKPRALHVEKALDVTTLTPTPLTTDGLWEQAGEGFTCRRLAECAYFTADRVAVTGRWACPTAEAFRHLLCLDGAGTLTADGIDYPLTKGDSVYMPAGMAFSVAGTADLLVSKK